MGGPASRSRSARPPVTDQTADVAPAIANLETIVSLSKRRGFIFPSSEIYGGINAVWDYGPLGVELKNNVKRAWWRSMVQVRDDIVGLDAGILMAPQVWVTSGHVAEFSDPLVECGTCHRRFRVDELPGAEDLSPAEAIDPGVIQRLGLKCPVDQGPLSPPRRFNLMLKTFLGPVEDEAADRLPPPGDGPGHLRQLQERPGLEPQEAALRHRPDRQGLPQRDQPRQLRLPHARVRADGDAVLRPPGGRRGALRRVAPAPQSVVRAVRRRARPTAHPRAPTGRAGPLRARRRWTSSTASPSAGRSWRASTTAATSTSGTTPGRPARTWSTSIRRPRSTSCPGSSRPPRAPTGPPSPSSSTPTARRRSGARRASPWPSTPSWRRTRWPFCRCSRSGPRSSRCARASWPTSSAT